MLRISESLERGRVEKQINGKTIGFFIENILMSHKRIMDGEPHWAIVRRLRFLISYLLSLQFKRSMESMPLHEEKGSFR